MTLSVEGDKGILIDEVLRNSEYRENANRLRQAIANTNGFEKSR
jgi:UDP:flavonoid glycosyltransferase YjiC (YdhE family)